MFKCQTKLVMAMNKPSSWKSLLSTSISLVGITSTTSATPSCKSLTTANTSECCATSTKMWYRKGAMMRKGSPSRKQPHQLSLMRDPKPGVLLMSSLNFRLCLTWMSSWIVSSWLTCSLFTGRETMTGSAMFTSCKGSQTWRRRPRERFHTSFFTR